MNLSISIEPGSAMAAVGGAGGVKGESAAAMPPRESFGANWQTMLRALGGGLHAGSEGCAGQRSEAGEVVTEATDAIQTEAKARGASPVTALASSEDGAIAESEQPTDWKCGWDATSDDQAAGQTRVNPAGRGGGSAPAWLNTEDAEAEKAHTQSGPMRAGRDGAGEAKNEKRERLTNRQAAASEAGPLNNATAAGSQMIAAASASGPEVSVPWVLAESKSMLDSGAMSDALRAGGDSKIGGDAAVSPMANAGREAVDPAKKLGMAMQPAPEISAARQHAAIAEQSLPNAGTGADDQASGSSVVHSGFAATRVTPEDAAGRADGDERGGSALSERGAEGRLPGTNGVKFAAPAMGAQPGAEATVPGQMQAVPAPVNPDRLSLEQDAQAHPVGGDAKAHAAEGESRSSAGHTGMAQPASTAMDAAVQVRVPSSGHEAPTAMTSEAHRVSGDAERAARGLDAHETFAAADAGTAVEAPGWIHAGARGAEAGFEDPALGWVGVKADLSGGSVHASLVAGSADAAQALSAQLEGLHAYLAAQHTPVATVTVGAPGGGGTEMGAGQNMQHGAGQNAGYGGSEAPGRSATGSAVFDADSTAPWDASQGSKLTATAPIGAPRGAHISVMA